jgi:hypothetical protein
MAKRILLVLAILLVMPFAVEGGLRLALRLRGTPYDAEATRTEIRTLKEGVLAAIPGLEREQKGEAGRIPHPYIGWDDVPRLEQVRLEGGRYRSGQFDESFEILVVGGSVSGLVAKNGADVIRQKLEADARFAGRRVVILSHGRGSFKEPQQVLLIAYLLQAGYRPDLILNIDGFNEVALGADNFSLQAFPLYPHWPQYAPSTGTRAQSPEVAARLAALHFEQAELARTAEKSLASKKLWSALFGRLARARVATLAGRCGALQEEVLQALAGAETFDPTLGPRFEGKRVDALNLIVDAWVEASRQIDALARIHGLAYLHVLQPTLHDPGAKPLTETELERGKLKGSWKEGVAEGYPRLRKASARLTEAGVWFLDGSDTFRALEEETYYDGCHFRGPGMVLFAERVADEILARLPE